MKRVVKSISFNLDDPQERQLYEIASKNGLFSKNVKRMLATYFLPIHPVIQQDAVNQNEEPIEVDSFLGDDEED